MSKALEKLMSSALDAWARFNRTLEAHNARQVAAWGSTLQYKRRYTNPDAAKLYRRMP